jgi:DNA invertase Pin-like site-specific DNA recombinase
METERLHHSLSAQVSYYSNLIQSNPEWEYAGVYADNAVTGTKSSSREDFQRMLADCEAGKIDIILTKSISRFARNTVDLLETVRHLKELGIEVRFEKEHINSLSGDGEVMLTLLASFAQEEITSLSENVKWGTRKRFEQGIPNGRFSIYGYRWEGDQLVIEPEEAEIVRLIYENFLKGLSAETTEKQLEEMGVKSMKGMHFSNSSIRAILKNITYTGNLLFQKEYSLDPISKKTRRNQGELPQYFVENTHEAIIPMETYGVAALSTALTMIIGKNLALMVSPLTPATYLAIGLTNTELKDHMKFSIPIYWIVSICMLVIGIIIQIIPV